MTTPPNWWTFKTTTGRTMFVRASEIESLTIEPLREPETDYQVEVSTRTGMFHTFKIATLDAFAVTDLALTPQTATAAVVKGRP